VIDLDELVLLAAGALGCRQQPARSSALAASPPPSTKHQGAGTACDRSRQGGLPRGFSNNNAIYYTEVVYGLWPART
jgi:hypothetical protein